MRFLGIKSLPPFSIDLPLGIMFPLHRRPRLSVVVREKGVPDAARSPTLTIETTNTAQEAVVVTGVYAGYIYGNTLVEVAVGRRTVKLPLLELEDEVRLPFVLGVGEAATCTANLYQLRKQLEENYLTLHPHSRFLEFNRIDRERWASYGRSAIMLRNRVAMLSSSRLAVVIGDDQGALHKAKVRWEPPGAGPHLGAARGPLRAS